MSTALATTRSRTAASTLVAGGLLTLASGVIVQTIVIPATDVSDAQFSYPWSPDMLIPVSILYVVFHLLIAHGLWTVRDRAGTRVGQVGLALAAGATLLLVVGEVASIPLRDSLMEDSTAGLIGALTFGLGTLITAGAMLAAGIAEYRARKTPYSAAILASGVVTTILIGMIMTSVMALAIGIYGLALAAVGWTARDA